MATDSLIAAVDAFRIWDSRGRPTIEVEVTLAGGTVGRGVAPAGASRGSNEALELRDGGQALTGFGVSRAIQSVQRNLGPAIIGLDALDQELVDTCLVQQDSSPLRQVVGGNALIATSMAVLNAAASATGSELWSYLAGTGPASLPLPEVQIFGGGVHAGNRIDVQDFLVMPIAAESFDEALFVCAEIYMAAGKLMEQRGSRLGVADEGGWWPAFDSNEDALATLTRAIESAGYGSEQVMISLDIAASEFHKDGIYTLRSEGLALDAGEWLDLLSSWTRCYPILSIEDPVAESDVSGMQRITAELGGKVQIVGDDYLVTNPELISNAIADRSCNAALIKPNQVGTISEARKALRLAKSAGWGTIISARSGETEDVTITHLAVGWNAGQLKVGSFSRSERMAKWNEGLRVERNGQVKNGYVRTAGLPVSVRASAATSD